MAKPTVLPIWNLNDTNTTAPNTAHEDDGWLAPAGVPEKPPYQYFNYLQRLYHTWLNEINIKGILGYDALTDYIADLSYVVGSDGNLYQCGINNGPASSTVNPVGDVTGTWLDIINVTPVTGRGYIDGLIMSNDTDTDHDISIAIGICRDSIDTLPIPLSSALVKQIDVNWSEGTADGGFPSGLTLSADTWYHFFIIMSNDGTKVDAGFDTSLTAVNLLGDATDYDVFRRVGSVLTDGSDNIIEFIQMGDTFWWTAPVLDVDVSAPGNSIVNRTISVPPVDVEAIIVGANEQGGNDFASYFQDLDQDDYTLTADMSSAGHPGNCAADLSNIGITNNIRVRCTDSRVATKTTIASGGRQKIVTFGWVDSRGKDL